MIPLIFIRFGDKYFTIYLSIDNIDWNCTYIDSHGKV